MIKNQAIIKYKVSDSYEIIQPSNIVNVQLINPIVSFCETLCSNIIKISIFNNSGTIINNVRYCICLVKFYLSLSITTLSACHYYTPPC
jgi:hypothetical protein